MVKRILRTASMLLCALAVCTPANAGFAEGQETAEYYGFKVDFMESMIMAAAVNDITGGTAAQEARNEKISYLGNSTNYTSVAFEDLLLLAKLMYAEAGSDWLPDYWKLAVGEVILNRRSSPEFPDTISGVLYQPGQYYSKGNAYFQNLMPSERCVRLALRLLEGERVLNNPAVVFQANVPQGSGIHEVFWDPYLGCTYFCYSYYPGEY